MVERRVETYRGCDIYHYDAGDITPGAVYGSPCVTGYWNTLAGCRSAIDRKLGAAPPPTPPPEAVWTGFHVYDQATLMNVAGASVVLSDSYGHSASATTNESGGASFETSWTPQYVAVSKTGYESYSGPVVPDTTNPIALTPVAIPPPPPPPPPTPPPEEERKWVEKYHDVDIYWVPTLEMYWAQVAAGYVAVGYTLEEVRSGIDGILEFLYPPEEPPEGLLAQIVAQIQAWLGPMLTPLMNAWDGFWTVTWPSWTTAFANLKAAWDNFWTWILPDLHAKDAELDGRLDAFDTETLPNVYGAMEAMAGDFDDVLAQKAAALKASEAELRTLGDEAVKAEVRGWFPAEFLKDPVGWILSEVWTWLTARLHGIATAFCEGLEEGLRGTETLPAGPGRSFWEGFQEGLKDPEEEPAKG